MSYRKPNTAYDGEHFIAGGDPTFKGDADSVGGRSGGPCVDRLVREATDAGDGKARDSVADVLEHDTFLSIGELVDGTYEDILDRTELQMKLKVDSPELAWDKLQAPAEASTLYGMSTTSSRVAHNFAQWVSRREVKRFAARLDKWVERRVMEEMRRRHDALEEENEQLSRLVEAVEARFVLLCCISVVALVLALLAVFL